MANTNQQVAQPFAGILNRFADSQLTARAIVEKSLRSPAFWERLEAVGILSRAKSELEAGSNNAVAGLIVWRAMQHILPGGIGGRSVVEAYFPEVAV